MSFQHPVEANRRNSQISTAPRAPDGKGLTALKSGINPKAHVIPGEDPAELEAMAAGYHNDWAPTTWLERFLVDSLVRADWLLQRLSRLEAELWTHHVEDARKSFISNLDEQAPIGDVYSRNCDRFTRLQRRIDSAERSYYRALTQLQRLKATPAEAPVPSPAPDPHQLVLPDAPELASFRHPPFEDPAAPPAILSSSESNLRTPAANRTIGSPLPQILSQIRC